MEHWPATHFQWFLYLLLGPDPQVGKQCWKSWKRGSKGDTKRGGGRERKMWWCDEEESDLKSLVELGWHGKGGGRWVEDFGKMAQGKESIRAGQTVWGERGQNIVERWKRDSGRERSEGVKPYIPKYDHSPSAAISLACLRRRLPAKMEPS